MLGRTRDRGLEALATESWKSRGESFLGGYEVVEGGGVGVTTSSRHCGLLEAVESLERGRGPVGVSMVVV